MVSKLILILLAEMSPLFRSLWVYWVVSHPFWDENVPRVLKIPWREYFSMRWPIRIIGPYISCLQHFPFDPYLSLFLVLTSYLQLDHCWWLPLAFEGVKLSIFHIGPRNWGIMELVSLGVRNLNFKIVRVPKIHSFFWSLNPFDLWGLDRGW